MKKVFILEELDCANCAGKMEEAIQKLDGVDKACVSFMSKKLIIEAEEGRMDGIVNEAKSIIKKLEPDVKIVCKK